jgi:hypothetical protein
MRNSNVLEAATKNMPACPNCGADQGDPCRMPSGGARSPHKERKALADVQADELERRRATITEQADLTTDAIKRGYRPGAIVRRVSGREVQLTSYPWFDGEDEDRSARVMARLTPGDCRTNVEMGYFAIMQFVREGDLDA